MSDTNRVSIAYQKESTFATIPGSVTLTEIRFTGESLRQSTNTVESQEIRSDRQIADVVRTSISAEGDINFELSYGTFDAWLASSIGDSAWASAVTVSASAVMEVQVGGDVRIVAGSGTPFSSFVDGQWIKVSGFTNAANNGYFKVTEVDSGTDLIIANGSSMVDTSGADGTVTIVQGAYIENGTTLDTYLLEKEYTDLSNTFALYYGMAINQMSMNIQSDQIITGSFSFIGSKEESKTATIHDTSSVIAAPSNEVMAAVEDISAILENDAEVECTALSFQVQNNLRPRQIIATLGAISLGAGSISVSGTVQMYFETATIMNKYLNFTTSSLAVVAEDSDGNSYIFDFPSVKYSSGQRVAGGQNQDIIADMAFNAFRDATEGITVRMARFPAS